MLGIKVMLGITIMLGVTFMLVWSCISLTSRSCTTTSTLHVALLCRGVFIRDVPDGAVSKV